MTDLSDGRCDFALDGWTCWKAVGHRGVHQASAPCNCRPGMDGAGTYHAHDCPSYSRAIAPNDALEKP